MNWKVCRVPDGVSGNWRVETFEVSQADSDFTRIRAAIRPDEYVPPGIYKRLMKGHEVVMSTTPFEERTHRPLLHIRGAERILLNGLGLGMALEMALEPETVRSVTVIEISPDVIKLVAPTFLEDPRVEIIEADALEWSPPRGVEYDFAWHDIWTHITSGNLPDITALKRKYGRRCKKQAAWCEVQARMYR